MGLPGPPHEAPPWAARRGCGIGYGALQRACGRSNADRGERKRQKPQGLVDKRYPSAELVEGMRWGTRSPRVVRNTMKEMRPLDAGKVVVTESRHSRICGDVQGARNRRRLVEVAVLTERRLTKWSSAASEASPLQRRVRRRDSMVPNSRS